MMRKLSFSFVGRKESPKGKQEKQIGMTDAI